jgi:hypothetical protein
MNVMAVSILAITFAALCAPFLATYLTGKLLDLDLELSEVFVFTIVYAVLNIVLLFVLDAIFLAIGWIVT